METWEKPTCWKLDDFIRNTINKIKEWSYGNLALQILFTIHNNEQLDKLINQFPSKCKTIHLFITTNPRKKKIHRNLRKVKGVTELLPKWYLWNLLLYCNSNKNSFKDETNKNKNRSNSKCSTNKCSTLPLLLWTFWISYHLTSSY